MRVVKEDRHMLQCDLEYQSRGVRMIVTRVAKITLGFYISFIASLAIVAFMSFPLGVYLGAPVACFALVVIGVVGMFQDGYREIFSGWLSWVAILGIFIVVTFFL
jgi:hypothetical protein